MVALFLVLYFFLLALCAFAWKKVKMRLMECSKSESLRKTAEEKLLRSEAETAALKVQIKALKKSRKAKASAAKKLVESKQETIRLLQEQLDGAQGTDKSLREANIRLANQLAEANDIISRIRDEW
jgi:uncharacterized protein HemX